MHRIDKTLRDAEEGMGTAPDPPPLPPAVKWVTLWLIAIALNCASIALAGPWAALGIFGGVFIALSVLGLGRTYTVTRRENVQPSLYEHLAEPRRHPQDPLGPGPGMERDTFND